MCHHTCSRPETDPATNGTRTGPLAPDLPGLFAAARQHAKPKRRVFPGRPDQAHHARRFVARALGDCPITDTAVLLTSELVTNALTHTRSAAHGSFQVIIWTGCTTAYIAVIDDGSHTTPTARHHGTADLSESGRGLELVNRLATHWGHHGDHTATTRTLVWFRLDWPPGDPCQPAP